MTEIRQGSLSGDGLKFAIVAGRFNSIVVEPLLSGAIDVFVRSGVASGDIAVYRCPGAFELPQLARRVVGHGGIGADQ